MAWGNGAQEDYVPVTLGRIIIRKRSHGHERPWLTPAGSILGEHDASGDIDGGMENMIAADEFDQIAEPGLTDHSVILAEGFGHHSSASEPVVCTLIEKV